MDGPLPVQLLEQPYDLAAFGSGELYLARFPGKPERLRARDDEIAYIVAGVDRTLIVVMDDDGVLAWCVRCLHVVSQRHGHGHILLLVCLSTPEFAGL